MRRGMIVAYDEVQKLGYIKDENDELIKFQGEQDVDCVNQAVNFRIARSETGLIAIEVSLVSSYP